MTTTATTSAGYVICSGACGSGKAGVTKHRSDSAVGQLCNMSSTRRSRKLGTQTSNLVHTPVGVHADQVSYTAPDWNDSDALDNAIDGMLTHYRDTHGEDSEQFRQTKKWRREIDYRLKAGLKDKEPSQDFDNFANNFLHDPALAKQIQSDYDMTPEAVQESISDLESRIRHPENIASTAEANQRTAKEAHLAAIASEYESIQAEVDAFNERMKDAYARQEEIREEFKKEAIEFAQDHDKEWLEVGHVQARFTPNTVLDLDGAIEDVPKNQRKALLKPEAYDPTAVRTWFKNHPKADLKKYLSPGTGAFSMKIVKEDKE